MTTVTEVQLEEKNGAPRALRADARRNREAVIAAAKKLFADEGLDALVIRLTTPPLSCCDTTIAVDNIALAR